MPPESLFTYFLFTPIFSDFCSRFLPVLCHFLLLLLCVSAGTDVCGRAYGVVPGGGVARLGGATRGRTQHARGGSLALLRRWRLTLAARVFRFWSLLG